MTDAGRLIFLALMSMAALSDVRHYRIPNLFTGALAISALMFAWPQDVAEALSRGLSAVIVGGAALGLYLAGRLGGGDVKLLAAAALWMPAPTLPLFLLALSLAGGVQACGLIAWRAYASGGSVQVRRMPYAVSIAAAGALWLVQNGRGP